MFSGLASYMSDLVAGSELKRIQKELEAQRRGNYAISYELNDLNFEHLRRKRAFLSGVNLKLDQEFDKEQLIGFQNLPDIVPIKPNGDIVDMNYEELMRPITAEEEKVEPAEDGSPTPVRFNYDAAKDNVLKQEALLQRFELIRKRKIKFTKDTNDKRVAVIYNPYVTGNRVDEIESIFEENNIATEFFICESNMDPYRRALDLTIDNYSAMIAVGGDGTLN